MKSIYKMVKGFAREAYEFAKQGAPSVTLEQYKQRLEACQACPHLKKDIERCGLCGCLVEHKAKWATAKCPDKNVTRWEPIKVGAGGKKVNLKTNEPKGDTPDTGDEVQSTDTEG